MPPQISDQMILAAMRKVMEDIPASVAWPPETHFRHRGVQPPASAYLRQDDFLQVNVLTSSATTNLVLRGRLMRPDGTVEDLFASLDGAAANTLTTTIIPLSEGFLLSAVASNLGGGLADSVCFVNLALQRNSAASTPAHTILAQGYITNAFSVVWPPTMPRGPATAGAPADVLAWVERQPSYPPATPNAMDDEFDGASLDLAKWTWVNQGAALATQRASYLSIAAPSTNGQNMQGLTQPLPAAPYEFLLECTPPFAPSAEVLAAIGVGIYDSVSTVLKAVFLLNTNSGAPAGVSQLEVQTWTGSTFAAVLGTPLFPADTNYAYLRVGRLAAGATPFYADVSTDGIHYTRYLDDVVGFTPDSVGIFFLNNHPTGYTMLADFDFFRRTI